MMHTNKTYFFRFGLTCSPCFFHIFLILGSLSKEIAFSFFLVPIIGQEQAPIYYLLVAYSFVYHGCCFGGGILIFFHFYWFDNEIYFMTFVMTQYHVPNHPGYIFMTSQLACLCHRLHLSSRDRWRYRLLLMYVYT